MGYRLPGRFLDGDAVYWRASRALRAWRACVRVAQVLETPNQRPCQVEFVPPLHS